ncbi:putative short-chain dehydrogenase [Xylaria sp. FL0933]|nr:putative short-chain dehydrogenase [Xylaria sp. FL0933]
MSQPKNTLLVTGANGGLGTALIEQITSKSAFAGYYGLYTVRDENSATTLRATLSRAPSHPHDLVNLDLADLDSVRHAAETVNTRIASGSIPPIQLLVLNAGFQDFGKQAWTSDGFDKTFSANYLGHWLLTLLLLKSMDKESGRIVIIGSQSHDPHDKRNESGGCFTDEKYKTIVQDEDSIEAIAKGTWSSAEEDPSWKSGFRRYGAAKLFLIMMMHELQRRLDRDPALNKVCIVGVDPGTMPTGLQRHAPWLIRVLIFKIVYPIVTWLSPNGLVRSPSRSASQVLEAATRMTPEGEAPKDAYYFDDQLIDTSVESRDVKKRDWLWKKSIEYAHLTQGETVLTEWN